MIRLGIPLNMNIIEEVTALRPCCCLSLGVILPWCKPSYFEKIQGRSLCFCFGFLLFLCVLIILIALVQRCGNGIGKCQVIHWPKKKKKGHSQDHFFECGACTEHDAVSLIFLASKQIRPRAKFHRQMFWVASLRLIRSKTEKWGTVTYLWLFP